MTLKAKQPTPSFKAFKYLDRECNNFLKEVHKDLKKDDLLNQQSIIVNKNVTQIDKITRKLKKYLKKFEVVKIVEEWMNINIDSNNKRFDKEFKKVSDLTIHRKIDYDKATKKVVSDQIVYTTKLIVSVPERLVDNLQKALLKNLLEGNKVAIRDIIAKEIGKSATNFTLIARNETLQINRALTYQKALALEPKEWEYNTASDEKVRQTHADANGRLYKMTGNTYGDKLMREINCRCYRRFVYEY